MFSKSIASNAYVPNQPTTAHPFPSNHCSPVSLQPPQAYFSPLTGTRILTTCQDNRLRVWDNTHCFGAAPDREIVHSHDFNRHLTPFKAEFDPKDHRERLVVVGRYISEPIGGVALHPVDIMDVATGRLLAELVDANLTTISPVNKPHPRLDVIVSGSSRSIYAWRPARDAEDVEALDSASCAWACVVICSLLLLVVPWMVMLHTWHTCGCANMPNASPLCSLSLCLFF